MTDQITTTPSNTYAAIKISKENVHTMLANVSNSPAGIDRLVDALWRFPYRKGTQYYFIGGNFRKASWPDYSTHILTQDELDLLFSYNVPKPRRGQHNPDIHWFPVTMKVQELDEVMA